MGSTGFEIAGNLLLGLMCMGKKMRGSKSGEKGVAGDG
jgi:hypothetical protein